jgi:hypothetical protein
MDISRMEIIQIVFVVRWNVVPVLPQPTVPHVLSLPDSWKIGNAFVKKGTMISKINKSMIVQNATINVADVSILEVVGSVQ